MSGRIRVATVAAAVSSAAFGAGVIPTVARADSKGSSVIVYACGSKAESICAIDPDGGKPRTLPGKGTLTGLTGNGKTYFFELGDGSQATGIFEGATSGGPTRQVEPAGYSGGAVSPDGRHLLAYGPVPCTNPGCDEPIDEFDLTGATADPIVIDQAHTMTYFGDPVPTDSVYFGWLGNTPITAHDAGGYQINNLASPSWVCIGDQRGHCTLGSSSRQIKVTTAQPSDPTGSPDGTMVAMDLRSQDLAHPGPSTIGIFNARTGKQTFTIGGGSSFPHPSFSPDGKQIAYVDESGLEVANLNGPGHHLVTDKGHPGVPFWGGTPPRKSKPAPRRIAPVPVISVPLHSLGTLRRSGHLKARCSLRGPGRVTIRATITAALARKLHLAGGNHGHHASAPRASRRRHRAAPPVTLAHATRTFGRRGRATLTLGFSTQARRALRRVHRLPVTLRVTTTRKRERTRHTSHTFTLR